jgi:hypothetical protein
LPSTSFGERATNYEHNSKQTLPLSKLLRQLRANTISAASNNVVAWCLRRPRCTKDSYDEHHEEPREKTEKQCCDPNLDEEPEHVIK